MMKRATILGFFICGATIAGVWAAAQVATAPQSLSKWMPGGAMLYLESSSFASQLRDWDCSDVQAKWLASKNHEQFMTTRLALKLQDAYKEFSGAADFAPDLAALETFSDTETALAVYDIVRLDLVYI